MKGNRIKELRIKKDLSLNKLSRLTGISKSYLSFLERDIKSNPSLEIIRKISEVLKVELEYLVEEVDVPKSQNEEQLKSDKSLLKLQIELSEEEINQEKYKKIKDLIELFKEK